MKRRIIAVLDWWLRLFISSPPHPLPPGRWGIVVRPDGSKAFHDRYGDNTDIEIIENSAVPHGTVYLIDKSFMEATFKEVAGELWKPDPQPVSTSLFLDRYADIPKPVKLIISGD